MKKSRGELSWIPTRAVEMIATDTHPPDLLQSLVVLQEEGEVLEGNVHVTVASLLPVFLHSHPTTRVCVLVDLSIQPGSVSSQSTQVSHRVTAV